MSLYKQPIIQVVMDIPIILKPGSMIMRVTAKFLPGIAECSTAVDTIGDKIAPEAPLNLTAIPAGWNNENSFSVTWTNPDDPSGIAGAYYKIGTPPENENDGSYTLIDSNYITGIAVDNPGVQNVYVWLKDNAGNYNYENRAATELRYDNVMPILDHTPVTLATPNTAVPITATVNDALAGMADVSLYYRKTGALSAPVKADMLGGSAQIPASSNTNIGLEYFIIATDSAGNSNRKPATGYYAIQANIAQGVFHASGGQPQVQPRGTRAVDYRIFSVPYELENSRVSDVFEDDLGEYDDTKWKLFDVTGNSLVSYPSIRNQNIVKPGKAFLLLVNLQNAFVDGGPAKSPKISQYTSLPLTSGWNLVGNPFDFDVPAESLSVNGEVMEAWYAGSNGWTRSETNLKRWEGLAIRTSSNTTLSIGLGQNNSLPKRAEKISSNIDWRIRIKAHGSESLDLDNFVGVYKQKNDKFRYLWHEPPRLGNAVSLTVAQADEESLPDPSEAKYSTVIVAENSGGYSDIHQPVISIVKKLSWFLKS